MLPKNIGYLFLIFVCGLIAYGNSFNNSFHFDDNAFVINNLAIRELTNLKAIWQAMGQPSRFVAFLSFAVDYQLYELNVTGYHVTNFIIHIITAFAVFAFTHLLFQTIRIKEKISYSVHIPLFVALIFLAHPVQTQAVTYITQRFACLAALFYLISLCCYFSARLEDENIKIRNRYFILCVVAMVLGMFTKEIVITLPLMIITCEVFFFKGEGLKKYKRILLSILGCLLLIPALFSFNVAGMLFAERLSESHQGDVITFIPYVLTQLRVMVTFLKLFIMPVGLNLDYDYPLSTSMMDAQVLGAILILGGLMFAAVKLRHKLPTFTFGVVWFFVTLLPNFIPRVNIIFEHKLYLASIGLCLALVSLIHYLIHDEQKNLAVFIVIAVALTGMTFERNKIWKNDITLWKDVVSKSPNKFRPNLNLGKAYYDYRQYDLASVYLNRAKEIDPTNPQSYNNIGLIYYDQRRYKEALKEYIAAIELDPYFAKAYLNRGSVLSQFKEFDMALADYNKALELNPKYSIVYVNRGNVFARKGQYQRAIEDYTKAIDEYVNYEQAYRNRGNAYKMINKDELALADYNKALTVNPESGSTLYHRSLLLQEQGQYQMAMNDVSKAVKYGFKVPKEYVQFLMNKIRGRNEQ